MFAYEFKSSVSDSHPLTHRHAIFCCLSVFTIYLHLLHLSEKKKRKLNLDGKITSFFLEIKNLKMSDASKSVITIRMAVALGGCHVIRHVLVLHDYCCSAMTLK